MAPWKSHWVLVLKWKYVGFKLIHGFIYILAFASHLINLNFSGARTQSDVKKLTEAETALVTRLVNLN